MIDPVKELQRLCEALDARAVKVLECEDWFDGNHPIPAPPAHSAAVVNNEARQAFNTMSRLAVTNMLAPIVKAPAKKLRVEGFQFGESSVDTDKEAWAIWQRNYLDADTPAAHLTAVKTGQAFGLVWPDENGMATITMEDPSQCIVSYEAGSRRLRRSALKRWVDEDGVTYATLYTPTALYKFKSATARNANSPMLRFAVGSMTFEPREVPGEDWPLRNPLGVVPLVELAVNRTLKPSPFGGGVSQFAGQLNEQRKINATVMNLLVTLENQAFRQRWATGWDYPVKEDGTPDLAAIQANSAARLMVLNGDGEDKVQVGEFSQADFRPFLDVLNFWTRTMSFSSSTPPDAFLLGELVNVADGAVARLYTSHISEVQSLADSLGEGHEELMRLALKIENNPKANDMSSSVRWAEFERRSATEQMGVAKDLKELGAPLQAVFSAVPDTTQQEAQRWVTASAGSTTLAAVLDRQAAAPLVDTPTVDAPGGV